MTHMSTASDALGARSFPLAISSLAIIGFVSVLVGTVTSMALTTLSEAFGASTSVIVWVTTAYLLAAGLTLPVAGWAVDRFGARPVLLVGVGIFVVGSLASGLANSIELLLLSRALQGLGGGVLEPACLALISRITERQRIGTVMGVMAAVINIAPAVGPLVGAALLSWTGWQGVFFFAGPPVIVAVLLLAVSLRRHEESDASGDDTAKPEQLDAAGLALLGVGFAALLLAFAQVGEDTLWLAAIAGVGGVVLLAAYVRRALRIDEPVVNPRLFMDRKFSGAVAIMGAGGVLTFSILTLTPMLAERVWNLEGIAFAMPLGAFGLGMLVSMSISGAVSDRIGPRPIVTVGAAGAAVCLAGLAVLTPGLTAPAITGPLLLGVTGVAFGTVSAPTFASIYRILPRALVGRGTTAALIAVQLGAALGVTSIGALIDALGDVAFVVVPALLAVIMFAAAVIARFTLPVRASAGSPAGPV